MRPGSDLTRTDGTASHQRATPFRAHARGLATVAVWLVLSTPAAAQVPDSHFTDHLYPALNEAGCRGCHTDAGVASGTRLHFPAEDASADEVRAFGLRLAFLVDRGRPEQSLLFGKPTNRIKHTGGERVPPGSEAEALLLDWVKRLATLSDAELAATLESGSPRSGSGKHQVAMRRLTHRQYNNTVRALLGDQTRPSNQFPSEDFVHGFRNQSEGQSIPPLLAEAYGAAAEKLARNAFRGGDRNGLIPCPPASADDSTCRGRFVREFGLKAFRRPLTEAEATQYERLFAKEAARTDDFLQGARIVVEAMFQSPSFLFLAEAAPGDELYPYTMASRLSFFLWDAAPNDHLLAEAAAGKLNTPGQIEATARRMLDDPRARSSMEEFLAQWLRFDRVLTTIRDRRLYRDFNAELAAAMTEETRRLFSHLAWGDENFMEFFTAKYGFVSTDLAEIYGFPAPAEEFGRVDFPADTGRAGLLGQAMFQTVTSKPSDTSVTERGLFIRDHFLCQTVPPPPPGLNAALPPVSDEKPMTNRQRLNMHVTNPACVSCHRLIDPIGFGFEQYDAIGRFREKHVLTIFPTRDEKMKGLKKKETKYELPLDISAEVAGIADSSFSSPRELGEILGGNAVCQKCVVKQLFRYAMGRAETTADRETIERSFERFRDSQFRFRELIISIVTSKPFLGHWS